MYRTDKNRVCPVEKAGMLDSTFRRLFQNPNSILKPHIKDGMTVLDLGCGSGFFAFDLAKMLHKKGKVIAADLQTGMLALLKEKVEGTPLAESIELHHCQKDKIGLEEQVDFVLAFYMIHEVPDQKALFTELKSTLKPGGKAFIIEPKVHVSKQRFNEMITNANEIGFATVERPKVFFSRTVVLSNS